MVLRIGDDGRVPDPVLKREILSLQRAPMDDVVNEAPHAIASRIIQHARYGRVPWVSSTSRLDQSLHDIDTLVPEFGLGLQQLWLQYKTVLPGKLPRMTRSEFELAVYTMKHISGSCEEMPADLPGPNEDGERPPDADAPEDPLGEGDGGRARASDMEKLIAGWLNSSLRLYDYFSIPDRSRGPNGRRAFQVLSFPKNQSG